jgi:hypothetical protein
MEKYLHSFSTLGPDGGEWSASHLDHFSRNLLYMKLSGIQSQSGRFGANKICLPLSRIEAEFFGRTTRQLGTPLPFGKKTF